ncbi:GHKL domain-containing protein [Vagococcus hydrophili]|uniref:GHKL domain-containing protein n=1 Tax=Vagococcus hydrophili TaxID=2714947 RepID=A0A6G8ASD5_9ENTE|nr:GHKL domain-containing protein [Vagococcus hydrophili]QIL47835.1 GHKL domain-containing protein [Vagococcus hydrophili]
MYIAIFIISSIVRKQLIPFIQGKKYEKIASTILIGCYILLQSLEIYLNYFGDEWLSVVSIVIILAFSILIYYVIHSISTSQELKLEVEKQKIELNYMNEYAKETTKQYNEIRKFRHDYINILSSLDYFIQLNDLEKLSAYYEKTIKPTQKYLSEGIFNFQELKNIEADDIKSIIAIKLLSAKEKEVEVQIEVPDIIPKILPVNSVVLIRMLGIILDNSIEEVADIKKGKIEVGLFDMENHYLFIIKNPIKKDILPLHQLEIQGYSTKGTNRGLGLSNLNELSNREKQLMLETEITSTAFIQKITLTKEVN